MSGNYPTPSNSHISLYSSRRVKNACGPDATLGNFFLVPSLKGASLYQRIAGYFCASILDIAGDELAAMGGGAIQVVCNVKLDFVEEERAGASIDLEEFLWQEWVMYRNERLGDNSMKGRLRRLHSLMTADEGIPDSKPQMEVRIVTSSQIGMLHGKAGLIYKSVDGQEVARAFMGSSNESLGGWGRNYELMTASESPTFVKFVKDEFDALWGMAERQDLPKRIIEDFGRLADEKWVDLASLAMDTEAPTHSKDPTKADLDGKSVDLLPVLLDMPEAAEEVVPEDYQKWFINLAFQQHFEKLDSGGARFVLADPVGLGKTIQMGLLAKAILLATKNPKPVLIVVPKTLVSQWQEELWEKMGAPSAIWDSVERCWKCEDGSSTSRIYGKSGSYPACPRRIGLVSAGLLGRRVAPGSFQDWLLSQEFELVMVDEAHRARPHIVYSNPYEEAGDRREYYQAIKMLSARTRSMILATATPIQMHPVEAWYLLDILDQGEPNEYGQGVLGTSKWRLPKKSDQLAVDSFWRSKKSAIEFVAYGQLDQSRSTEGGQWGITTNPLPIFRNPITERGEIGKWHFGINALLSHVKSNGLSFHGKLKKGLTDLWQEPKNGNSRDKRIYFFTPFTQRIVRRDRDSIIEVAKRNSKNPESIKTIQVIPFGDSVGDAIHHTFQRSFDLAKDFCQSLSKSSKVPKGFVETLLLRRLGSSSAAAIQTAEHMLAHWCSDDFLDKHSLRDLNLDAADSVIDDQEDGLEEADRRKKIELNDEQANPLKDFYDDLTRMVNTPGYEDPKLTKLKEILFKGVEKVHEMSAKESQIDKPWIKSGCIIFSQYFTTAETFAYALSNDPLLKDQEIGLYAGGGRSSIIKNGQTLPFVKTDSIPDVRTLIKKKAQSGKIKLIFGTDAASEGLNLQVFMNLVNLDMPWNPTRLEQRKGRIQRRGQRAPFVRVFNMRYENSIEDKVFSYIVKRLKGASLILGQLPDYIEEACAKAALGDLDENGRDQDLENFEANKGVVDVVGSSLKTYYDETLKEMVSWDGGGYVIPKKEMVSFLSVGWERSLPTGWASASAVTFASQDMEKVSSAVKNKRPKKATASSKDERWTPLRSGLRPVASIDQMLMSHRDENGNGVI